MDYHIARLVRALLLGNLGGHILLYSPLKFKAVFVAKMFRDLSPSVLNLTLIASKSLKLFFTSLDNNFRLIGFAFEVRRKFEPVNR